MASTAILAIRIVSDATKAARELQGMDNATGKWAGRMEKANRTAKVVGAGILAVGAAAFKQASQLQQASGAVDAVFGRQSGKVHKLAKDAANSVGLAQSEYSELASVLGAQLGNLGVSQDKLVGTTDSLISTGADLSAQFGGTTKEAVEALSAAFRGETDPIEKYGVSIKEATVKAELARRGQDKLTGAAAKTARTQAMLALITQQTSTAQGAFAREAGTAAGAQQRAMANLKNAGAQLGMVLLPVVAALATKFSEMATWVQDNATKAQILLGVIGGLAVAVMAVNAAMKVYAAGAAVAGALSKAHAFWTNAETAAVTRKTVATKLAAVAQRVLNVAMRANPIGLIITAVVALVAGFILLYKRSETFRKIVQAVGKAGKAALGWVVDGAKKLAAWVVTNLVGAFRRYQAIGQAVMRAVATAVGWVIGKVRDAAGWVRDKLGGAFRGAREVASGAMRAVLRPIQWVIDKVRDLIGWIRNIRWPSPPGWLKSAGGAVGGLFGSASLYGQSAPTLRAAGGGMTAAAAGAGGGQPAMIVIQGALDPDAVARQVEKLLGRRARRIGVVR